MIREIQIDLDAVAAPKPTGSIESMPDLKPGQKVIIRIPGTPDFEATFVCWADDQVAWVECGTLEPVFKERIFAVSEGN